MLKNYLKIAWRNMTRNKTFSAINILGLALGLAGSLMIMLWVQHERSTDRYHEHGPVLYNVMENQFFDGNIHSQKGTPALLAGELKKQFPEIVRAASFSNGGTDMTFAVENNINIETGYFAGSDWFGMFSVPLLAGTPETALNAPGNLAVSRKLAEKYFGSPQAAVGKSIRIDNEKDYLVTAVFENLPDISSLEYDFLLSWQAYLDRNGWMKDWRNNGPRTVIQLRPDADVSRLEAKLKHFLKAYNKMIDPPVFDIQLFLQSYGDAYLYSNFRDGHQDGGRIEYVRLFTIVAVFLVLIACINFMNLATARSVKRAREVGVRKVAGAGRGLLAGQFAGEALLFTFLALVLSLAVTFLLLPAFNLLTEKNMQLPFGKGWFWLAVTGIALLTGLVAGSYPALFLSSLNPVRVLKGSLRFGRGARLFRQGLVVFQFLLSMLLIVGTIVIHRQINFVQSENLGYDRENLVYVPIEGNLHSNKAQSFKEELLRTPGVKSLCPISGSNFFESSASTTVLDWTGKDPNSSIEFFQTSVGYDFVETAGLTVSGRDFSRAFGTDTANYLINETAARRMGYDDPIGQPLSIWGRKPGKIVGVLKDFHLASLHEPIRPAVIWLNPDWDHSNFLIRIRAGQTEEALADIERLWKTFNPQFPFTYKFVDDEYDNQYKSETVAGTLAGYFAFMAIFISCLGLLGLSAFMAEQRTKEIGVRKVLGASVQNVISLLSKDFLRLVFIAIILASPLAWYAMNKWLANFTYHIDMEWWIFALAGLLAVLIALLTVSFQSVKAALMNPVKSLRSE